MSSTCYRLPANNPSHSSYPAKCVLLAAILALLVSCARPPAPERPETTPSPTTTLANQATHTLVPIPTLLPTATPFPTPAPIDTPTAGPTLLPETPIPFGQSVVELNYEIPVLDLSRQLQGDISSRITLTDTTTGGTAELRNQAGVLLELQSALLDLELADLPDDCPRCVHFSYALPVTEVSASGWLTDTQMLASVENFMAAHLGPHFPPDTIAGLRRSASPYHAAHTAAITETGGTWIWSAIDPILPPPTTTVDTASLATDLASLPAEDLADAYTVNCEGATIEQLSVETADASKNITIICPSLSLPLSLLPLYLQLDGLIQHSLAADFLERPPPPLPLSAVLDYRDASDTRLTLLLDGGALLSDEAGEVLTATLSSEEVLELVVASAETGALDPELDPLTVEATGPYLAVRGDTGWLAAQWDDGPPNALLSFIAELDEIVESLAPGTPSAVEATPTLTSTPQGD